MKGLVGCPESQTKARCLDEVKRPGFVGAVEFIDELELCITPLASRASNPGDIVTWLVEIAVWTNL
jgi:hypothetical protein